MFDDEKTSPDLVARLPMRQMARRCVLCPSSLPFEHKGDICESCRDDISAAERSVGGSRGPVGGVYRDAVDFGVFR